MSSVTLHEPYDLLSDESKDKHRAIVSLMEELEAIDWYQQRADVTKDEELRAVLLHNKNEEVEHAMMTLEWLLRNDAVFGANAKTYLFAQGPITQIEAKETEGGGAVGEEDNQNIKKPDLAGKTSSASTSSTDGSLGIGSLKG